MNFEFTKIIKKGRKNDDNRKTRNSAKTTGGRLNPE